MIFKHCHQIIYCGVPVKEQTGTPFPLIDDRQTILTQRIMDYDYFKYCLFSGLGDTSRSMEQHGSEMDRSYCYHGNGNIIFKVPVESSMESVH